MFMLCSKWEKNFVAQLNGTFFSQTLQCCVNQLYFLKENLWLLYIDFSYKQLLGNALAKEFSLLMKGKCFRDKNLRHFPIVTTTFFISCLKLTVYKVTKDFPLDQL